MNNIACRIFKEQLDVILCLPEQEQGKAIIAILKNAFGIEYNHTELSAPAQSIVNLLKKTIVCKEFSSNYGGKRTGAGKKKQQNSEKQETKPIKNNKPTLEQVLEYARMQNSIAGMGGFPCTDEQAEDFFDHYAAQGWIAGNGIPIHNWQHKLREWVKEKHQPTKPISKTQEPNDWRGI